MIQLDQYVWAFFTSRWNKVLLCHAIEKNFLFFPHSEVNNSLSVSGTKSSMFLKDISFGSNGWMLIPLQYFISPFTISATQSNNFYNLFQDSLLVHYF